MSEYGSPKTVREFFQQTPERFTRANEPVGSRVRGEVVGNPDIPDGPHRRKFFPTIGDLDAYISDSGLDTDAASEYIFVAFNPDGSVTLYIKD